MTHLYRSRYLLAAVTWKCFIVPKKRDKNARSWNSTNFPSIASVFSKNHLLDVLASFQGNDLYELREG